MRKHFYALLFVFYFIHPIQAQWTATTPFDGEERDGAFTLVVNGSVYIGGGILSNEFWHFVPLTGTWAKLDSIGDGNNRCFSAAFEADGKGYIVGGDFSFGQSTNEVWSFDPSNDTWQQKNNFTGGSRVGMFAFTIGNRAFAGGGTNTFGGTGYGTTYNDFYEYNPATDTWTALSYLPVNAAFASSFAIDGKGYVAFGAASNALAYKSLYCFDTATMAWTQKADCPGTARSAGVGFALNGKGYAGLGQYGLTTTFQDFYEYNPATNTWAAMPDYPDDKSGWSAAYVLGSDAIVGTGTNPNLEFSNNLYHFVPQTATGIAPIWKSAGITAYPNPFSNEITLAGVVGETVTITNIAGKTAGTFSINEKRTINLAHLPAGIYTLLIEGVTIKICKQ